MNLKKYSILILVFASFSCIESNSSRSELITAQQKIDSLNQKIEVLSKELETRKKEAIFQLERYEQLKSECQ